jgi:hypothetical protein
LSDRCLTLGLPEFGTAFGGSFRRIVLERQPADRVENGAGSVDAKGWWDLDRAVAR